MDFFKVNLPNSFLPFINHASGNNVDAKVKQSLVIGMYVERQITLARAAELAELSLVDFIDLLETKSIPWMYYSEEHLEDDRQAIQKLLSSEEESI